eukprot:CAMPEP_0204360592 /NCGR_PEP_ID=MMETSP0469-20131031/38159_1 /ASSEMBLY_ACC=CAM_ASM_000384 /TAXON_ID=2969 /ORGANISM="Oxyrrhis marina" /LENGTH=164 /DNA_ID=CAMNT_0051348841 /DNA_START=1 /DNA_END=495 /DNA_ORIENTATION=-
MASDSPPPRLRPVSPRRGRGQIHCMASQSPNPHVQNPRLCESPQRLTNSVWGFGAASGAARPINRRNYWSPSHWIEHAETFQGKKGDYTHYALTQGYHDFWKHACKQEGKAAQAWNSSMRRSASGPSLPLLEKDSGSLTPKRWGTASCGAFAAFQRPKKNHWLP